MIACAGPSRLETRTNSGIALRRTCRDIMPPDGSKCLRSARHPDASSLVVEEMISLPELKTGVLI